MNVNRKYYINHKFYDDIEKFVKVHNSFCNGQFTHTPHRKESTTHQKRCNICGCVGFVKVGEYRNKMKVFFNGFIPNSKLGIDQDSKKYGHKLFNNHCVACGTFTPTKTQADLCPSCKNRSFDESYTNHEEHATSHANRILVWQQGNREEVNAQRPNSPIQTTIRLRAKINNYRFTPRHSAAHRAYHKIHMQEYTELANIKQAHKEFRHQTGLDAAVSIKNAEIKRYYEKKNKLIHTERTEQLKESGFYVTCDNLIMQDLEKQIKENPCMTYRLRNEYKVYATRTARKTNKKKSVQAVFNRVPLMLFECAISEKSKAPTNAEIIEVTRATKHVLSPSWKTLNQYKKTKNWTEYVSNFMQEMNHTEPRLEMISIIEKAKDHPVYLSCFEVVGHCHRFLLLEWINNLYNNSSKNGLIVNRMTTA